MNPLIRKTEAPWKAAKPYLAEAGAVGFSATAAFALFAVAAEFLSPGFVVNFLAPRSILIAGLVFGALSLLDRPAAGRTRRQTVTYVLIAAACAISSFWAAWYYFTPVAGARAWMALAAGTIVGAVFALAALAPWDGGGEAH